jgi:hypothetical protein
MIAACLLLAASGASAQKLVVSKQTIQCEKTGYEVPVTANFEIRNKGQKRLVIKEVRPDCGCTRVQVSKNELGAGEKAIVALTYDARMLGHYVKQAALYTNASEQPVYLTMKGVVLSELKDYSGTYPYAMGELLADMQTLEFDDVNKGDHPFQEIHILNNSEQTMTPNIQHLPPYLSAVVTPEKLAPGHAGKIMVTLNSAQVHSYGLTQTSVYLASQLGEKVQADNEVPVSVVLLPDLKNYEGNLRQFAPQMELSDSVLNLGMVDGKVQRNGTLVIANNGRTPLKISSLQMFTRGLKLTLDKSEIQPGDQAKLKVTADFEKLLRVRTKPRVLMITNDPDHPKVVITINVK